MKLSEETLPQFRYQRRNGVSSKSWHPQSMLGADTETLDGKCRMLTLEKATKVDGEWVYKAETFEVNSIEEILETFLSQGRSYHTQSVLKNGSVKRQWYWMTPNWFFWNLKFDEGAITHHLTDEEKDSLYETGEMERKITLFDQNGILKIKSLTGKYTKMTIEGITIKQTKLIRTDGNKLFTSRLNKIVEKTSIKAEAKRYGVAPATIKKWLARSQPRNADTRRAIMVRGKRLVKEKIKSKVVENKISPIELWDIAQFYNKMRLDTAGKKYLGYGKMEKCFDGSILDVSRLGEKMWIDIGFGLEPKEVLYWEHYKKDIIKYANIDAEICGQLTRLCRDDYVNSGIRFKKTYSPANVGQQALMATGYDETINLVESCKRFKQLMEAGVASYHGGRFEVQRIGYFENMVGVDLVSAYWYVLYHLVSLIDSSKNENNKRVETYKGVIIQGNNDNIEIWNEWMEKREPFTIGFIDVEVEFPKGLKWYPLISQAKTTLIGPRIFKGKICAEEYEEMLKWNPISVKTGDWIYHRVDNPEYPFREIITECLTKKCNSPKGSAEYATAKVVGSSLYGKTQQAIDNIMGGMWHSAYSATITGATRARLSEICRLNNCTPAMMATDGLIFNKDDLKIIPPRPKCKDEAPNKLGEWEIEEEGDCLIIGSGVYSFIQKGITEKLFIAGTEVEYTHPSTHKTTFRGTAKSFLLRSKYTNWYDFCIAFQDESKLSAKRTRPQSLKEIGYKRKLSKRRNEKDEEQEILTYEDVNIFKEEPLTLNPCTESSKRVIGNRPKLFGDLLKNQYLTDPHESVETANKKQRKVKLVKEMIEELGL